jgi:hypothetical protein
MKAQWRKKRHHAGRAELDLRLVQICWHKCRRISPLKLRFAAFL